MKEQELLQTIRAARNEVNEIITMTENLLGSQAVQNNKDLVDKVLDLYKALNSLECHLCL